ncbi:MAG: 7-carboxy-7-deazaguanine synthase QueE [Piscirickettsiaceae bacterium]|nr:MAG: 7-carboxy-7-deazaguanine synthase QueE [Piscirickettsiaceae bacterium]PCI70629.1 MAG: 7-carboxy-7-deazaguanine synthase QueE [Piscirickettsiaceae bacterium]
MSKDSLRITEIFYSLQGEGKTVGLPTTFVRLTGCPLRCGYCDTEYAFHGGETRSIDSILEEVAEFGAQYINVTGGEPLAQKRVHDLMNKLCDQGYHVSLETSGALDVSEVDSRVIKVIDVKTPGSGEVSKNLPSNYQYLSSEDQIKYVICDEADFVWSKQHMQKHTLNEQCEVLFSPVQGTLPAAELANWVLRDKLPVRFQIQLHKHLWGDVPGK